MRVPQEVVMVVHQWEVLLQVLLVLHHQVALEYLVLLEILAQIQVPFLV